MKCVWREYIESEPVITTIKKKGEHLSRAEENGKKKVKLKVYQYFSWMNERVLNVLGG